MSGSHRRHLGHALSLLVIIAGCRRDRAAASLPPVGLPADSAPLGSCADPARDGIRGPSPRLERADRDLNGDGVIDPVTTDRGGCDALGNCHWNLFVGETEGCTRLVGLVDGTALQLLPGRGEGGLADLRAYYQLAEARVLVQEYRAVRGAYLLVDAVACRRGEDDVLQCASDAAATALEPSAGSR